MNRMDTIQTTGRVEKRRAFRRMTIPFGGRKKSLAGFSLVEIMVGMTIGLLGILAMLQMLSFSENQKRTTSGSDDAQNAGAIALYGLQREIQPSGRGISGGIPGSNGLVTPNLLGCSVSLPTGVTLTALAPVTINYAPIAALNPAPKDTNTDTVMVVYGNFNGAEEGDAISAQASQINYTAGVAGLPNFYNINDYVIAQFAVRKQVCSLILDQVATTYPPTTNPVIVKTGVSGMVGGRLYDLGQSPTVKVYAVYHGNLTVCDYTVNDCGSAANVGNPAIWVLIAGNIVSLNAQYGRDTNSGTMNGIVDTWDQSTPPFNPPVNTGTLSCDWARITAVRVALVAQGNSGASNTPAPTWAGGTVNLTAVLNWQNYHYKVFQTYVPIRNINWMQTGYSGC